MVSLPRGAVTQGAWMKCYNFGEPWATLFPVLWRKDPVHGNSGGWWRYLHVGVVENPLLFFLLCCFHSQSTAPVLGVQKWGLMQ